MVYGQPKGCRGGPNLALLLATLILGMLIESIFKPLATMTVSDATGEGYRDDTTTATKINVELERTSNNNETSFSIASRAYPMVNPKDGFSLLDDRGVVAGTCKDKGWDYIISFSQDKRTPGWDATNVKSHRTPGIAAPECGYGFEQFYNMTVGSDDAERELVMLDIGANMGLSMLPYWTKGWKIVAFEPIPDNISTLRRNLFINGIPEDQITLIHGAVTNTTGHTLSIYAPRGRTDNTALSRKGSTLNVGGQVDVFEVPAVQIDTYLDNAVSPLLRDRIALIKIDTQGHELSVLQGMQKLLKHPPNITTLGGFTFVIIAEYAPNLQRASGHEPEEMLQFMRKLGYEVRCEFTQDAPIVPPQQPNCNDVIFSIGKPGRP